MSDAPIKIVAGRPSDALQRERLASWSFSGLLPRHNYTNYRAREGRNILETLRLVRDRDPDAAQAVSNFLLLMGQGYQTEARRNDKVDDEATAYLRSLDARIGAEYGGGMDMLVDVLNLTLVTQGAMALEIQVADDLEEVADFHPVDPQRITAKRDKESGRLMWGFQAGRSVAGADADGFLELSPRQFRYMPLHPDVDDPYGRSPIMAALTAVFFKVQVLDDLRAVVHNQGYPRMKAEILEELIANLLPATFSLEQRKELIDGLQVAVAASMATLNPDDTIVFPSSIKLEYLGIPSGTMVDVEALSNVLDKQITSGLKMLPILLGRNEGATTTHASIQWRIFVLLIEALRRRTKRLLEWAHTTALQIAGYQATAHVTFEELQTNDRVLDAQAFETEVRTWKELVTLGYATDEEASNALLQHDVPTAPGSEGKKTTRSTQPILGYHIEQGVVSRNESREQLGLEPQDETQSERLRTLQAVLTVVQAAVNTRIPLESALVLAGLQVDLPVSEPTSDTNTARSWRRLLRHRMARTRAIEEDKRLDLETALRTGVSAMFTRLVDEYPIASVAEAFAGTTVDTDEVNQVVADWFAANPGKQWSQELTDVLVEHYRITFNVVGQAALDELSITASFDLKNPAMIEALDDLGGQRVTGINTETQRQLINQIVEGVNAGEGVDDLGRRLRTVITDMSVYRSQLIATTEVASAAGIASLETYTRNGVERKGWITAGDGKVTDGCAANADASPIAMGKAFPSGHDAPPRFPGCRCSVTPVLDGYEVPKTPWIGA